MAIVTVGVTDTGDESTTWSVPRAQVLVNQPIPRGLRAYNGTQAIALKSAGDETAFTLTITFPNNYAYLLKSFAMEFESDDTVNLFESRALMQQQRMGGVGQKDHVHANLVSPGNIQKGTTARSTVKVLGMDPPTGYPRLFQRGDRGDLILISWQDIDASQSTAGDIGWNLEFFQYDLNQLLDWPVNAPLPVFNY